MNAVSTEPEDDIDRFPANAFAVFVRLLENAVFVWERIEEGIPPTQDECELLVVLRNSLMSNVSADGALVECHPHSIQRLRRELRKLERAFFPKISETQCRNEVCQLIDLLGAGRLSGMLAVPQGTRHSFFVEFLRRCHLSETRDVTWP